MRRAPRRTCPSMVSPPRLPSMRVLKSFLFRRGRRRRRRVRPRGLGNHLDGRPDRGDPHLNHRREMSGVRDARDLLQHPRRAVRSVPHAESGADIARTAILLSRGGEGGGVQVRSVPFGLVQLGLMTTDSSPSSRPAVNRAARSPHP